MRLHCSFEQDLLDAVAARRWPARAEAALVAHVDSCRICGDVAEVAVAFFEDAQDAPLEAKLPAASTVWWRSQIRARQESARAAARPMVLVQAIATAAVAAAAIAAAPAASVWVRDAIAALGAISDWPAPGRVSISWVLGAAAYTSVPMLAAGLWIVLAPVVVYFALDE